VLVGVERRAEAEGRSSSPAVGRRKHVANITRLVGRNSACILHSSHLTLDQTHRAVATMNWTGGSLQRTKKANTGTLQQQKAYFAKARTQLQNANNIPIALFRPSYLRDNAESDLMGGMFAFGSGSVRHIGHSVKRRDERSRREASIDARQSAMEHDEPLAHDGRRTHVPRHASSHLEIQARTHKGR
jgi:hypothetical protein